VLNLNIKSPLLTNIYDSLHYICIGIRDHNNEVRIIVKIDNYKWNAYSSAPLYLWTDLIVKGICRVVLPKAALHSAPLT